MSKLDDFGGEVNKRKKRRNDAVEAEKSDTPQPCNTASSDKKKNPMSKTQWAVVDSGVYLACSSTVEKLYSGAYTIRDSRDGVVFKENPLNVDDLIDFPDSTFSTVIDEVEKFWALGNLFEKYGFLHRRGYLFFGPAGSGKSCLIQRLMQDVIHKDGVIFIGDCHPVLFSSGLKAFREVEPDRKLICIFEDVDALIEQHGESELLSLLDGENQANKVINIATTNYPQRLDPRIIARPRRFDQIIKIDMPNEVMRKIYFKEKLKINGEDSKRWVDATEGLSFASLAELVISVKCLGNDFDETVVRLKEISKAKISSDDFNSKIGFGSSD